MATSITVTPSDSPAPAPPATAQLVLRDYAFSFRKPLTAGTHIVQVTNEGPQVHDVELVRLDPGASIEQFLQALEPGSYAFACLAPDRADGAPHFAHGMVYSFDVS